jgi:DNA-binding GntR family transcriptional regulator
MVAAKSEETLKSKIHKELRRSVIAGQLKPGERLDIEQLARHYDTSITPVRDVLHMLSQEGLVTIKPRSGYFVSQITVRQLSDLLEIRELLEAAAVQRAAERITPEQLERLVYDYTGDDDEPYDRYIDENRRFHCLIAEAAGNQELVRMLGRVHDQLARFMFLVFRHVDKTQQQTHARIIEALRAHDPQAASEAMLDEIRDTREVILARVVQQQGAMWSIGHLETAGAPRTRHGNTPGPGG